MRVKNNPFTKSNNYMNLFYWPHRQSFVSLGTRSVHWLRSGSVSAATRTSDEINPVGSEFELIGGGGINRTPAGSNCKYTTYTFVSWKTKSLIAAAARIRSSGEADRVGERARISLTRTHKYASGWLRTNDIWELLLGIVITLADCSLLVISRRGCKVNEMRPPWLHTNWCSSPSA